MSKFKKIVMVGTMLLAISITSVSAFATGGNGNVAGGGKGQMIKQQDSIYQTTGVRQGTGIGSGGAAKKQGIGGMELQDGACYIE